MNLLFCLYTVTCVNSKLFLTSENTEIGYNYGHAIQNSLQKCKAIFFCGALITNKLK